MNVVAHQIILEQCDAVFCVSTNPGGSDTHNFLALETMLHLLGTLEYSFIESHGGY